MFAHYEHFQQGEATSKVLVDPFITDLMSKVVLMDAGSWRRQEASWRSTTSGVSSLCNRDLLIWQKWEFLYCHANLGLNDQDRKIYGIIFICCHIGKIPP